MNEKLTDGEKHARRAYREGCKGGTIATKSPNNVASASFNTAHLFQKDLRFEHEGAKLASCPGRHLTSVHPCMHGRRLNGGTKLCMVKK